MNLRIRRIQAQWEYFQIVPTPKPTNQSGKQGATSSEYWIKKNSYYHAQHLSFYASMIPPMKRVLHINCQSGALLDAICSSFGVGIGIGKTENLTQIEMQSITLAMLPTETFDYVILSFVTQQTDDAQKLLEELQRFCTPHTRVFVDTYSYVWEPLLWLSSRLGLRRTTPFKHWITTDDLDNFFYLTDFDPIRRGGFMLMPIHIPLVSWFFNHVAAQLPIINKLCLHQWVLVRLKPTKDKLAQQQPTVSVVVPCRNERGTIQALVERLPLLGASTEIIFVEGGSTDNTREEITRVIKLFGDRTIHLLDQTGHGKGDAVRAGFEYATGQVLMILDADLSVPPEDLPRFLNALISRKGELINGSRLVYGMESDAMRFLNLCANFFFAHQFSWILGQRIKDTLCGTKVLWKHDYETIKANQTFFGNTDPFGDFDLLFGASKIHLKIIDMPITYRRRVYGTTNISRFRHGIILLWMSIHGMRKLKFYR